MFLQKLKQEERKAKDHSDSPEFFSMTDLLIAFNPRFVLYAKSLRTTPEVLLRNKENERKICWGFMQWIGSKIKECGKSRSDIAIECKVLGGKTSEYTIRNHELFNEWLDKNVGEKINEPVQGNT